MDVSLPRDEVQKNYRAYKNQSILSFLPVFFSALLLHAYVFADVPYRAERIVRRYGESDKSPERFTAGELTVQRGSGKETARSLRRQAERIMAPWLAGGTVFLGV